MINPDKLRSRALAKYEFIRDYIMQGTIYLSKIREDLTFEVLNLFPDYDYPGKINSKELKVDKNIIVYGRDEAIEMEKKFKFSLKK